MRFFCTYNPNVFFKLIFSVISRCIVIIKLNRLY
nr:MAG TPA: hypothetical protein [Caudoviricetes sp.]